MSAPTWCRGWSRPGSRSSTSAAASASPTGRMRRGRRCGPSRSTARPRRRRAPSARKSATLKPDIVIDMICFTLQSAEHLVEALARPTCSTSCIPVRSGCMVRASRCRRPRCSRDGPSASTASRRRRSRPICSTRRGGTASRRPIVHPGHIVGPGWKPLNPAGHFNPQVFAKLARGEELALPNFGLETVHHVHADDVAQVFMKAIANWSVSVGEAFHAVSPAAVTLRGYAEAMAAWFGQRAEAHLPALAGMEGAARARRKRPPPGSTSPAARAAASPRRSGCSATSRATHRSQAVYEVGRLADRARGSSRRT